MEVWAQAKNIGVSPRKIRLILDAVKGKKVGEALMLLRYLPSPWARVVAKVVKSAAANAENNYQMHPDDLKIVKAFANPAPSLKRWRPRARGRTGGILRRFSHLVVVVNEEE